MLPLAVPSSSSPQERAQLCARRSRSTSPLGWLEWTPQPGTPRLRCTPERRGEKGSCPTVWRLPVCLVGGFASPPDASSPYLLSRGSGARAGMGRDASPRLQQETGTQLLQTIYLRNVPAAAALAARKFFAHEEWVGGSRQAQPGTMRVGLEPGGHPRVILEGVHQPAHPTLQTRVHLPGASPVVSLGSLGARNWLSSRLVSVGTDL